MEHSDDINLASATPNVAPSPHPFRAGVCLTLPEQGSSVSPVWTMAGWRLQFVRLAPGARLYPDHAAGDVFLKVVVGALQDPQRRAYPQVGSIVTTRFAGAVAAAGVEGAVVAVFTRTSAAPAVVSDMAQLLVDGPLADQLRWETFESRYSRVTPYFNGADAHLVPGFHLLDGAGVAMAYVFFWTAGKGVDLSTHNHGNTPSDAVPAFAEVHQVLCNGTGLGGMYQTEAREGAARTRLPMQSGDEHGPFFEFDAASGRPRLRENGAVAYPWHGWQGGTDDAPGQRYDLVCAYEITVPYARVR